MKRISHIVLLLMLSLLVFADDEGSGAKFRGQIVLQPSGATFTLPDQWVKRYIEDLNINIHTSAKALARVKYPEGEWHEQFGKVINSTLPFDSCTVHAGASHWGKHSASPTAVQMRVYVFNNDAKTIGKLIQNKAMTAASELPSISGNVSHIETTLDAWAVDRLSFRLHFHDYSGTAKMDFYTQQFGGGTVVLAFMYAEDSRNPRQQDQITSIVDSFVCKGEIKPHTRSPEEQAEFEKVERELAAKDALLQRMLKAGLTPGIRINPDGSLSHLALANRCVKDISSLRGLKIDSIELHRNPDLADISPLSGMRLKRLWIDETSVSDLSPLTGMPLEALYMIRTQVQDISPLKGMPLRTLYIFGSTIGDLSPLEGMELTTLSFSPQYVTNGIHVIREMKSLRNISIAGAGSRMRPDEFWRRYDAGEFGSKPTAASQ